MIGSRAELDAARRATAPAAMRCAARRGTVYLIVLVSVAVVVATSLAGMMVVRTRQRATDAAADAVQARAAARSAVELGVHMVQASANWRDNLEPGGDWITNLALGRATVSTTATDPVDGDITNSDEDPLDLVGVAQVGQARHKVGVRLQPTFEPLDCLSAAICAKSSISLPSGSSISADAPVVTNASFAATSATVRTDVEAVGTITGSAYYGTRTPSASARTIPGTSIFDDYVARGTAIPFASLPSGKIEKCVLSANSNPFTGVLNKDGIYVVDCKGQKIEISTCRIVGTLVVLDPRSDSIITSEVLIEPARAGGASLLVRGAIAVDISTNMLTEASVDQSLNPPGTPYAGVEDTDLSDEYPQSIGGLVFVSDDLTIQSSTVFYGSVIVGDVFQISGSRTVTLTYDAAVLSSPPTGFGTPGPMVVDASTWARVVDP